MSPRACDRKRLLIADDDAATRTLYEAIITESIPNITVELAANGAEAVELFADARHGVLLMDLHMPVKDGLAAYREIDEMCQKKGWELPYTVFCTAYAPPKTFANIMNSGKPHSFLSKPVTSDQLVNAVREHLDTGK
jgi:two-component system chemotaxis response regulator CheY